MFAAILLGIFAGTCSTVLWVFVMRINERMYLPNPKQTEDYIEAHKELVTSASRKKKLIPILAHLGMICAILSPIILTSILTATEHQQLTTKISIVSWLTECIFLAITISIRRWRRGYFLLFFRDGSLSYRGRLLERKAGENLHNYLRREFHAGIDLYKTRKKVYSNEA